MNYQTWKELYGHIRLKLPYLTIEGNNIRAEEPVQGIFETIISYCQA